MSYVIFRSTFVIANVFQCRKCGAKALGDKRKVDAPYDQLDRCHPRANDMPVGWRSGPGDRGALVFQCPSCNKADDEEAAA